MGQKTNLNSLRNIINSNNTNNSGKQTLINIVLLHNFTL